MMIRTCILGMEINSRETRVSWLFPSDSKRYKKVPYWTFKWCLSQYSGSTVQTPKHITYKLESCQSKREGKNILQWRPELSKSYSWNRECWHQAVKQRTGKGSNLEIFLTVCLTTVDKVARELTGPQIGSWAESSSLIFLLLKYCHRAKVIQGSSCWSSSLSSYTY